MLAHSETTIAVPDPEFIFCKSSPTFQFLKIAKNKRKNSTYMYPTGQKYSLHLMFAKFATAKIAKDLNPLKDLPLGASCLKTIPKCSGI